MTNGDVGGDCAISGKPYRGKPDVRFDEGAEGKAVMGNWEPAAQNGPAPRLYSTGHGETMKSRTILVALALVALCQGCIRSLYPFYGSHDKKIAHPALALRLPRKKKRDNAFALSYNRGHESNNQHQRETLRP